MLPERTTSLDNVMSLLKDCELVTEEGWNRILIEEKRRGKELNKIKEKVTDKTEMIAIANRK